MVLSILIASMDMGESEDAVSFCKSAAPNYSLTYIIRNNDEIGRHNPIESPFS